VLVARIVNNRMLGTILFKQSEIGDNNPKGKAELLEAVRAKEGDMTQYFNSL